MVHHIDVIFIQGSFRPLEPVALREGTHVHLRVEEETNAGSLPPNAKIYSPKLGNPKDAADFVMQVRDNGNAGV